MNCCTNPIDLGCRPSCAPITTNIAGIEGDLYTIVWTFNGVYQSAQAEIVNGFLKIPGNTFNESEPVNFLVYDADNVFVACYKATMRPGNVIVEDTPPTPVYLPLTTSITLNSEGCENDLWRGVLQINLNTLDGLQGGSIIDLHHEILHNGNSTPHALNIITPGISYVNDLLTILDPSQITNPIELEVTVSSKNCKHSFTIDAQVNDILYMANGYDNTMNYPLTQFVWP